MKLGKDLSQVKEFRTCAQQLEILKGRGLIVNDEKQALEILKHKNYYRLSAYSLTLRKNNKFYQGITFDNIYELYRLDNDFRKLVLKYSSIIEVSFKSFLSHYHSELYGPLGYLDENNFEDKAFFNDTIMSLEKEIARASDVFIHHHKINKNYTFPFWVAIEVLPFGEMSKMFKNLLAKDKNKISKEYVKVDRLYLENWLQAISVVRNIAAHNGRFYNRKIKAVSLKLPKNAIDVIDNEKAFAFIFAIHKLLYNENLKYNLINDFDALFKKYTFAKIEHLGFPVNWEKILNSY